MCKSVLISLAFLAVISAALAQTAATQTCAQASSMDFNNAAVSGVQFYTIIHSKLKINSIQTEILKFVDL